MVRLNMTFVICLIKKETILDKLTFLHYANL